MRIPKNIKSRAQQELFEDNRYTYRIFCTSLSGKAHEVINIYDKRADVEYLIGEAKQEGMDAIPSARIKNNYAFFQIAMLAYNLWRYYKIMTNFCGWKVKMYAGIAAGTADNKIRIGRLKLLMICAKVVKSGNRDIVKHSNHDTRTPALLMLYEFLDRLRFGKYQECKT